MSYDLEPHMSMLSRTHTHTTYREAKLSEDSDEEMETDPSAPNAPSAPPKTPKHDLMMVEEVRYVTVAWCAPNHSPDYTWLQG